MLSLPVFASVATWIVYVLAGYPFLLACWARRGKPVQRKPMEPPVSILLAVHNGEAYLENKLRSILGLEYPGAKMEVLVISDGSTDNTAAIARRFASEHVTLIELPRCGKAAALNAGMARAHGEILVFTDVRQTLAPESLRLLVENFADASVGAVSGELTILQGPSREEANVGLYWRYELAIRLRLSAIDSIFGATGAYYAIRRSLAAPLPEDTLLDDMHLPLGAFFRGYRLIVDPRARMFDYPTGLRSEFRRKVRTLAGNYQILRAYPQLLGPGNRMWFHFVSYKFARLLLPFALLGLAGLTPFLPEPWRGAAITAQVLFYAAALCDLAIPEGWRLKRLTSPVRTFVTLMAAALCAVSIFLVPSQALWSTGGRAAPGAN